MHVPLLDVNAQNLPLESELKCAFERVLRSGQFIMGPDVAAFEAEIAAFLGVKHAVGVSSGTDAILLALMALGIGPGDEVLCPSFTFFATAGCVVRAGATPVFVDSDPVSFNLDVRDAERKITPRTKAVMPVHLFGQCADMDATLSLARSRNLHVIEDAAQSLGAKYKGRPAGAMGAFGAYSFFPSKNLGAMGDAGMLVTNDDALGERARILRTHGAKPKYFHKYVGANFRLDTLQAAFLRVKLPRYAEYTRRRKLNAVFYDEKFGSFLAGQGKGAGGQEAFVLPQAAPESDHIWNQYTLRVPGGRRDPLRQHLTSRGIGTEIYYPRPMHRQECFAAQVGMGADPLCPVADRLAGEVLSIPIYPEISQEGLETVAREVVSFFS